MWCSLTGPAQGDVGRQARVGAIHEVHALDVRPRRDSVCSSSALVYLNGCIGAGTLVPHVALTGLVISPPPSKSTLPEQHLTHLAYTTRSARDPKSVFLLTNNTHILLIYLACTPLDLAPVVPLQTTPFLTMRIALAQTSPISAPSGPAALEKPHSSSPFPTLDENLVGAVKAVEHAVAQKADIVVFPEYFLQGIANESRQVSVIST